MSLRTVLAVTLAVAVVGVAIPGVDRASVARTDHFARGEVATLADAGTSLLDRDEVVPVGQAGARRIVTVSIPAGSFSAAELDYLAVGGVPGESPDESSETGVIAYRIAGHPPTRIRVPVPIRPPGDRPLVVRESGDHRLVVRLVAADEDRVVVVDRR